MNVLFLRRLRLKARQISKLSSSRAKIDRRRIVLVAAMVRRHLQDAMISINTFQLVSYMVCWLPYALASIAEIAGVTPISQVSMAMGFSVIYIIHIFF